MVVPQGQDVIPRRPRGGASCKGVISRRPRGDATLLGLNSIVLCWCLIMRICITGSCSFEWFGISCVVSHHLCLTIWLNDEYYDVRMLCTSLPFRLFVWLCVVFLLCNDHQFYWCEHMWELVAVVMTMGILQLDGYGRVWGPLWSTQLKEFSYLVLSFWTRTCVVVDPF